MLVLRSSAHSQCARICHLGHLVAHRCASQSMANAGTICPAKRHAAMTGLSWQNRSHSAVRCIANGPRRARIISHEPKQTEGDEANPNPAVYRDLPMTSGASHERAKVGAETHDGGLMPNLEIRPESGNILLSFGCYPSSCGSNRQHNRSFV